MRSSPAYAVSNLELPAVTVAARVGGLLVPLAAVFLAWAGLRAGSGDWLPAFALLGGGAGCVGLWRQWRGARSAPVRRLEARPDGSFWLHQAGSGPVAVALGRGTRLLGPSVFLDLRVADTEPPEHLRYWITPFDVPGHVMRQWSVVLPLGGRAACT